MTRERLAGLALIAGAAATIVTMLLHPTAHDLLAPGAFEAGARRNVLAHGLALASLPLVLFGALGLARRLAAAPDLALAGVVLQGFAAVALMLAAVASGLVATDLIGEVVAAGGTPSAVDQALFEFDHHLNQAFARVAVWGSSLALAAFSLAILRSRALPRWLGAYGLVLAPLTVLALAAGHLRLDVHGFGLVVLGQSVWLAGAGTALARRAPDAP